MSAPRLWASLHIPLTFDYRPSLRVNHNTETNLQLQEARQAGLNQWIRRSGAVPLAISLFSNSIFTSNNGYYYAPDPSGYETSRRVVRNAEVQETIDLVAQYAHRFSSLQVIAPFNVLELLGQAIQQSFNFESLPHLRRIQFSCEGAPLSHQTNAWSSLFFSSATLQDVCLRTQMEVVKDILPSLQTSNITTLSLHHAINPTVAQHLLNRLVHLERCHLSISIYNSSGPHLPIGGADMHMALEPITATIHLPCLKELSITSKLADLPNVCGVLRTPSLSKLQLSLMKGLRSFAAPDGYPSFTAYSMDDDLSMTSPSHSAELFSVFLSQCSSLRTLIIDPSNVEGPDLQSILSHLPQVEHLVIQYVDCPPSPGALISPITYDHDYPLIFSLHPLLRPDPVNLDQPLLPALTSFSWNQYAADLHIPSGLFVDFVKGRLGANEIGRQRPTATLCNINFRLLVYHPDSEVDEEIVEEIAGHAESVGLKRGVDFHLNVSSVLRPPNSSLESSPMLCACKTPRYTDRSMRVSEDNVLHEYDVTWPWIDI